jgi:predicted permease
MLVESGLLAALGAALGIAFAYAGVQAALAFIPVNVVRMKGVALDTRVLGFAILLAVVTTLGAGLAPALQLARVDVAGALVSARADVVSMRRGVRRLLIVTEAALSLVLVLGAVLLARSLAELRRIDLGFVPRDVLTLCIDLPRAEYSEPEQVVRFYRELVDRVKQLPPVQSAGAARILPLTATIGNWSITIENRAPRDAEHIYADWQIVTPGYLETMRIEIVKGRLIQASDSENAPLVAVINETMARRYWPGEEVIGKRFHLGTMNQPWVEIVGLTRDVRHNAVVEDARAEMCLPHAQWVRAKNGGSPQYGMTLVIRTAGEELALVPLVRDQVRKMDAGLPISEVRTLEDVAAAALAQPRFTMASLGVFAGLALALAATGLYGVTAFMTARRRHEIGIRVALGARPKAVTGLIVRDGLAWAAGGVAIGLAGSPWITRLLAGQLYGVKPLDPLTYAIAPAILLAVAAFASYLPAWRAARASPVAALRNE